MSGADDQLANAGIGLVAGAGTGALLFRWTPVVAGAAVLGAAAGWGAGKIADEAMDKKGLHPIAAAAGGAAAGAAVVGGTLVWILSQLGGSVGY